MFNTYISNNSLVHKLNPVFKLAVIFIIFIMTFFINNYMELVLLTLYLIAIILHSNIKLKKYLDIINDIKYILLFILIMDLIFLNFYYIIFDLYRITFIIIIMSIYLNTTRNSEILYSLQKVLNKFKKYIPSSEVSLLILLILKFIPIYINRIRKVRVSEKNIIEKIRKVFNIYKKEFSSIMNKTKKIIALADINLYNYNIERKSYYAKKWGTRENYLLVLNIVILFIVIYY